jgi:hypothetical protein
MDREAGKKHEWHFMPGKPFAYSLRRLLEVNRCGTQAIETYNFRRSCSR